MDIECIYKPRSDLCFRSISKDLNCRASDRLGMFVLLCTGMAYALGCRGGLDEADK